MKENIEMENIGALDAEQLAFLQPLLANEKEKLDAGGTEGMQEKVAYAFEIISQLLSRSGKSEILANPL